MPGAFTTSAILHQRIMIRQLRDQRNEMIRLQQNYWNNFDNTTDVVTNEYIDICDELTRCNNMLQFYKKEVGLNTYYHALNRRMHRFPNGRTAFYNEIQQLHQIIVDQEESESEDE